MTMLRLPILTALTACLALVGCDADTEEVTATASESGGDSGTGGSEASSSGTSDGGTSTTASSSTVGESATAGTETGPGTGTGTGPGTGTTQGFDGSSGAWKFGSCDEATDEFSCTSDSAAQGPCSWIPTSVSALDVELACGDLDMDGGRCVKSGGECGQPSPTCPDGTTVFYLELGLEVGAVELLVTDEDYPCELPDGFQQCQVNSNPKPGSEPSYFPEECACACE